MGSEATVQWSSEFKKLLPKLIVLVLALQFSVAQAQDAASLAQSSSLRVKLPLGAAAIPPFRTGFGAKPRYLPTSPADPADPYIVSQATALGNNPNQIFAFVRDQIAFEAYYGSVRGARGALWAKAGNTLDKASLLIALLGAAGYTAQYEHADIINSTSQVNLLHGMFPQTSQMIGCIPPGTATGDPAYNGNAEQASADYYWVQYGAGNIALDPNVPGATPGQSFQTPDTSFSTVPQNLRQQVTVKINAEIYSAAGSLFGQGPGTTTVLTQTFDASALVGNVITAGNFVTGSGGGALDVTATTFSYTPYLLIGSGGSDISQDQVITGTPYQEFYTNFPLGSQVLTGLFLEVDADDITGTQQVYTHTMFDRLGPAARQGNANVTLNLPSTPAPAFTDFDLTTVNILTARQPMSSFQAQQTRLTNAYNNYEAFKPTLAGVPTTGSLSDSQQAIVQQGITLTTYMVIAENELITMAYDGAADTLAPQLETTYFVRAYPNSPRLTIAQNSVNLGTGAGTISLDVLKNDMFVIGGLGQSSKAPYYEEVLRGMIESQMEGQILSQATGQTTTAIGDVFAALGSPNLLTMVAPPQNGNPEDPDALSGTTLSADAQTLILNDVANGNIVITPTQMVTVNGATTVGWWETDANGHTVSHFANGNHQAIADYTAIQNFVVSQYTSGVAGLIGHVEGFAVTGIAFDAAILQGVAAASLSGVLKATKQTLSGAPNAGNASDFFQQFDLYTALLVEEIPVPVNAAYGQVSLLASYATGLLDGIKQAKMWLQANLPKDPEVFQFVGTPLGLSQTPPTPGTTPGVQMGALTVDPQFTMPVNGNQLPLVFDLPITNTGPATDTFKISISNGSQYYQEYPSVASLTLLGGQTGMVNVCVMPYDSTGASLPPVGQAETYTVTVTSATNSSITTSTQPSFGAPASPGIEISTDPATITMTPGGTVSANLNLASVGNVATGPVTLTAAPPTGLSVNSLTSPVSVPLNGTATEAVSFTAAGNLANGGYEIPFTASYTPAGGTAQQVTFAVPIAVAALGSCAVNAAPVATQLGKTSLAADLARLATDMNLSAAAPSNTALVSRVVGDMNVIISQELTAPYLAAFAPNLTTATNAVAAATPTTLVSALANLSSAICPVGTALNQADTTNTSLSLQPTSALADGNLAIGPNSSATWNIVMVNNSPVLHVYNLSTTGVPSGITVQLSEPTLTLGPAGSSTSSSYTTTVTLTTGATFNMPFTFLVIATPQGAPDFAVSAFATLQARPESIHVDQVTATPQFANAGTPVTISARVFAVVNEQVNAVLTLNISDPNGNAVCCQANSSTFTLSPSSTVQTITFNPLNTTGFINGAYKLSVQAEYGNVPQGAAATGSLLIGSPLSGALSASPSIVAPGSSTVQATLTINRDTAQNPVSNLIGTVPVNGVPRTMALYTNGSQKIAYVCADDYVNIVDVTNSANLTVLGTFAHNVLTTENGSTVPGFQVMSCAVFNNSLILSYSRYDGNTTASPIPTHFATFSLANPLNPVQVGSVVDIARSDSAGLYVAGNVGLMFQSTTFYNPYSNFIFQETGDIWAADLTNAAVNGSVGYLNDVFPCGGLNSSSVCNNSTNVPAASYVSGNCVSSGTTPIPNDPTRGGPYRIFLGTAVNSTTSYFGSTDANGGNIENPSCPQIHGQLLVVDTTTPSSPAILSRVNAGPMTFMTGIAVQGNVALGVGDSTGIYDINSGFVGTLVLSSFDISNPTSPVLLNSVTTQLVDKAGSFVVPLGQNTFAVGNTTLGSNAELVLVDATNPAALRYVPYNAAFVANPAIAQNGYFYALSATPSSTTNSLSVFQLTTITGPQLSVSLQIPTAGNATLVPGSFNQTPSSSTAGSGYTTYVWNQPSLNTITFNMSLNGVSPGDVTTLVNSGQMNYTLPTLGSGTLQLGALSVLTQHILSISPASQSVANAGNSASYMVTVTNPTSTTQTFVPSVAIPASWGVQLPASVTVSPGGSQNFNLVLTTPINLQYGAYTFVVTAQTAGGIFDSVPGTLTVNQTVNLGGNGSNVVTAFTASLSPSQVTAGRGDNSQPFMFYLTNTGNQAAQLQLGYPTNLPNGWSIGSYVPAYYANVQPNTSTILTETIAVPRGTTPGPYAITIPVQDGSVTENLSVTVNVSGAGMQGYISPNAGTPATAFTLTLTNSGTAQDTFNLSVVGPLAQAASIESSVTLAAGASSPSIPITLHALNYVLPANAQLQIQAVSKNDPNVVVVFPATVTLPATKSVTAAITPSTTNVSTNPGTVNLLFDATNTGNATDSYSAQIIGTTGPVTATLVNTNGQSGQSIPLFYAPGLGTAQFPLNATVTGIGKSTVTVAVTSLTSPSVTANSTVTINGPAAQLPPVANAGAGGSVPLHRIAILNGSASSDPNVPPLTLSYAWTLVSAPSGSAVTTSSIGFPTSPEAVFVPDVLGAYTFKLTVTTTAGTNSATVGYTAQIFPPVAVPGKAQNAATGQFVFLNGKDSYDPNSLPLTFAWTFASLPSGSALTAASLLNSNTPKPFFTPDVSGVYSLQLTVSNGTLQSTPVAVSITTASGNLPPNANAGYNRNAPLGQTVTLDGSASYDPNTPALALTYLWTFQSVPAGSTLTSAQIVSANTTAPRFVPDVAGNYVLDLHVVNSKGSSDDTVTVQAFSGYSQGLLNDVPPNTMTGPDQYAVPANQVNLTGAGSADPDSGPLALSDHWWFNALPASSTATLSNANTATPSFTPDRTGFYIGRLEASDGFASGFSNTLVTAAQKCDADANGVVNQIDIQLIQAALGQTAGANDPRDPLAAGTVTAADLTYCQGLVTTSLPNAGSTPPALTFTGPAGTTPASQTLTVTSTGTSFAFTVATDQSWLTASPPSGTTATNSITVGVITSGLGLTAQTLHGNVVITSSGAGNSPFKIPVTLNLVTASVGTAAGTPQIANVSTQFAINLQALVTDMSGNPVPGATVTFTAPSAGASGTFLSNGTTVTVVTNNSGVATAPAFTANATPGNYTVTASVGGAGPAANFALTNAVSGPTSLGGAIAGKSGPTNARVWIFEVGNDGPGSALNAQITGMTFVQTAGPVCSPVITTPFPLAVGNIAPQVVAQVNVTINFTGCANTAAFTVTAPESANNGAATGTIVRLDEFQ